jgi:hypothetical protein
MREDQGRRASMREWRCGSRGHASGSVDAARGTRMGARSYWG